MTSSGTRTQSTSASSAAATSAAAKPSASACSAAGVGPHAHLDVEARVPQVQGPRTTLVPVADDRHPLTVQGSEVAVVVVVDGRHARSVGLTENGLGPSPRVGQTEYCPGAAPLAPHPLDSRRGARDALLAACGPDDGRNLAEPNPELTAVPVPTTTPVPIIDTDAPLQGVGPGGLTLSSPDFAPGATMPEASACGGDLSPALEWTAPPRRVTGLALVVQDIDADGVAQWVVTDISPGVTRAPQGEPPRGSEVRLNSAGVAAWSGPCPQDAFAHRIVFTLYALDKPLPVTAGDAGIRGHRHPGGVLRLGQPARACQPGCHRRRVNQTSPTIVVEGMRSRLRFRPRPAVLPDRGPWPERVLLGVAVGLLVLVAGSGPAEATAQTTPTSVAPAAGAPVTTSAVGLEPLVADDAGSGSTGLALAGAVAVGIIGVMGGLAWLLRTQPESDSTGRSPSPASGA